MQLTFLAKFTARHRLTLAPMAADLTLRALSFAKCSTIDFVNSLMRGANSIVHLIFSSFNNLFLTFILFFTSVGTFFKFDFALRSIDLSGTSSSMIFNRTFSILFQCSWTFNFFQSKLTDSSES